MEKVEGKKKTVRLPEWPLPGSDVWIKKRE